MSFGKLSDLLYLSPLVCQRGVIKRSTSALLGLDVSSFRISGILKRLYDFKKLRMAEVSEKFICSETLIMPDK